MNRDHIHHQEKWGKEILKVPSGWQGLEKFMIPIIEKFNVKTNLALEFGVDSGYSLFILSQLFDNVIGVDTFEGDIHIGHTQGDDFYKQTKERLNKPNISLVRDNYKNYIKNNNNLYDLIHIDIVHLYNETYECAEWSIQHSNLVLLHDITSFNCIHKVCEDLESKYNLIFNRSVYSYNGLGILYNPNRSL
jgi:hypothetical protein